MYIVQYLITIFHGPVLLPTSFANVLCWRPSIVKLSWGKQTPLSLAMRWENEGMVEDRGAHLWDIDSPEVPNKQSVE